MAILEHTQAYSAVICVHGWSEDITLLAVRSSPSGVSKLKKSPHSQLTKMGNRCLSFPCGSR